MDNTKSGFNSVALRAVFSAEKFCARLKEKILLSTHMFTHSHTSSNILYQKMTHFDFLLRIGVRIGVRIARVVLRKKVLTPSSCRRRVATQMLPRKCCHANVATQMLPANVAKPC